MARLVGSLIKLREQVNVAAPDRSKASDGWIGDSAHSARRSDHNVEPDGTVDALDITHDPAHGCDVHGVIFPAIVASRDPRVKYLISNGRICSGRLGPQPWVWRPYSGSNRHEKHGHVSVLDEGQDDMRPWSIGQEEEDWIDMASQAEVKAAFVEALKETVVPAMERLITGLFEDDSDKVKKAVGRATSSHTELVAIRTATKKTAGD